MLARICPLERDVSLPSRRPTQMPVIISSKQTDNRDTDMSTPGLERMGSNSPLKQRKQLPTAKTPDSKVKSSYCVAPRLLGFG